MITSTSHKVDNYNKEEAVPRKLQNPNHKLSSQKCRSCSLSLSLSLPYAYTRNAMSRMHTHTHTHTQQWYLVRSEGNTYIPRSIQPTGEGLSSGLHAPGYCRNIVYCNKKENQLNLCCYQHNSQTLYRTLSAAAVPPMPHTLSLLTLSN